MFDNKFTKKDPLAESVRQVMIENDIRRQVELTLNEQLGIQSRKQLPHELHERYDATLNAAITNALTENCSWSKGKMEETVHPNQKIIAKQDGDENSISSTDLDILRKKKKAGMAIAQEEANVAVGKNPITTKDPNAPSALEEKLTKKMSAGDVISDFVHSKDPKFAGKPTKERQKMALGAYYGMHPEKSRSRKQMDESVQAILEEIRSNLQEQFVYIYENYDDSVMEQFINSLTEEQAELLGLNEAGIKYNPDGSVQRPSVSPPSTGRNIVQQMLGISGSNTRDMSMANAEKEGQAARATRAAQAGRDQFSGIDNTPPKLQSTPRTPSVGNDDISPPAGGGDIGIKPPPSFRQSEIDSMKKLDHQTATVINRNPNPVSPPASGGPGTSGGASRPAPAERPQRPQRSSDSGSGFSGPSGRAGFDDRGSDFGG